ncbi:MAG: S-methyl-5'-thioadenosine phosphorylase [Candidatus Omnitrophica bacterium]|nr:S-methyl-5'-thioadenosine phosphorylase [Candidatus Omnitrophota bacterium]MCM8793469.1 S-methyl-5'-thioadenosine phosphorylase [Candidatus Omnitrophota bacterium]
MGRIGIIGGSGLYKIEGLKEREKISLETPFGKPSDNFIIGELEGREIVFLPRHGIGHRIPPSEINYRANIYGMKKLGVERIISLTACGSLKENIKPLDFVVVDQFVDRTHQNRKTTFFDQIVVHIGFSQPVCRELFDLLYIAGKGVLSGQGINIHRGGTYINIEGPAFSTFAESNLYRKWGMDVIGMTNMAEAKLAREAEICYATLAAVTDFDCWHPHYDTITIEMVLNNLQRNIENAKRIISLLVKNIPEERTCLCKDALKDAIVTDKKLIPEEVKRNLEIIIGRYVK